MLPFWFCFKKRRWHCSASSCINIYSICFADCSTHCKVLIPAIIRNDGAPDIYCEDVDFDRSLQIVLCCYEHSRLLLSSMPSSQLHPLKDPNSTRKFIGELPETFTTEDAMQIGVKYDFSRRKISRLIKSFIGVKINKISHGKYQKIS